MLYSAKHFFQARGPTYSRAEDFVVTGVAEHEQRFKFSVE